jgi:hypothetical protein
VVFLLDESDSYHQAINGISTPEVLFVSAEGVVEFHQRGSLNRAELEQHVQRLLD